MIGLVKFIYSEKATKFCEIFPLLLTVCTEVKSKREDFAKFCGLLRIYELYGTSSAISLPSASFDLFCFFLS